MERHRIPISEGPEGDIPAASVVRQQEQAQQPVGRSGKDLHEPLDKISEKLRGESPPREFFEALEKPDFADETEALARQAGGERMYYPAPPLDTETLQQSSSSVLVGDKYYPQVQGQRAASDTLSEAAITGERFGEHRMADIAARAKESTMEAAHKTRDAAMDAASKTRDVAMERKGLAPHSDTHTMQESIRESAKHAYNSTVKTVQEMLGHARPEEPKK